MGVGWGRRFPHGRLTLVPDETTPVNDTEVLTSPAVTLGHRDRLLSQEHFSRPAVEATAGIGPRRTQRGSGATDSAWAS